MVRIAIIDGQGGAIGAAAVKKIRQNWGDKVDLWALGTNVIATTQMMKAGANRGTSGENAICRCVDQVDVIVGTISILISNALMGELTPAMAVAIGSCKARKLLLPLTQEAVTIVGSVVEPLPHMVEKLISEHLAPLLATKDRPVASAPALDPAGDNCATAQQADHVNAPAELSGLGRFRINPEIRLRSRQRELSAWQFLIQA